MTFSRVSVHHNTTSHQSITRFSQQTVQLSFNFNEIDSRPSLTSAFNTLVLSPVSSQCPVTCGVGRITRQVDCSNYHQPVDQSFCDPDEKPATEQECAAAPCSSVYHRQRINDQPYGYPQDPGRHPGHSSWNVPSADNQWRTGPWGAVCSACDLWGDRDVQKFSVLWQIHFRCSNHHLLIMYGESV